jgi:addiction module HigA family antidote
MIKRDINKIPKASSNPAAGVIEDMIAHHNTTQSAAAKAMGVAPSLLNETIRNKRGVSPDLALRFEHCFGFSAKTLMALQADYDFRKAYHTNFKELKKKVKPFAPHA